MNNILMNSATCVRELSFVTAFRPTNYFARRNELSLLWHLGLQIFVCVATHLDYCITFIIEMMGDGWL